MNKSCSWYLGLQNSCWAFARRSHGLADISTWKRAVRPLRSRLNRLNQLIQWPTAVRPWPPRGGEMAARRLCSAQPGHDAPSRTPFSRCLGLSSSQQQPPSSRSSAVAIASTSSPSLPLHPCNASTSAPAIHCFLPCSLAVLGKPPHHVRPHQSSAASPVTVAGAPQSTSPCVS